MRHHPAISYFCRMRCHSNGPILALNRFLPVIFLLVAFQFSCGNPTVDEASSGTQIQPDSSGPNTVEELIAAWPEAGLVSGDTVNVHGKCVVIMGPSAGSDPEKEVFFRALMDTLKGNFKTNVELTFLYSGARYVRVFVRETGNSMVVDRNTFNREPGVMVSDGLQAPKMKNGVFTEEEFSAFIREYFFIPS